MKRRRHDLVLLFDDHGQSCAACKASLVNRVWHADHVIPLAMGGADAMSNLQPLCLACHRDKTGRDLTHIAKAKRIEARRKGVRKRVSRPLPGGKSSPWKRKINGEVVRR